MKLLHYHQMTVVKLLHYHQVFVVEVVHMERHSESCPTLSSVPDSLKQRHLLRKPECICLLVLPLDGSVQARKHNQGQKGQTPRHISSGKGLQFR